MAYELEVTVNVTRMGEKSTKLFQKLFQGSLRTWSTGRTRMNHKKIELRCITFIKFFLKRNCPYMKNLYKVFLINCLSLNLMIIKPIECEGVINEHELLKSLPSIDNE